MPRIVSSILGQVPKKNMAEMADLSQVPNVPQVPLERYDPPRGMPKGLVDILTPDTAKRLTEYAKRGEQGGREWYNLEPLRLAFEETLGADEGMAAFNRYVDIVAATSPRSRVDQNIRRSSYLYGRDRQGQNIAGMTNPDFPKGYGHLAHNTQDALLKDLQAGGTFEALNRPKTSSFAHNLKGNQAPMTMDTHNFAAVTGNVKNKVSPSNTQYRYVEDFQREIADKLDMTPAQYQASVWMGGDTGVADSRPFMEVFDDVLTRTAEMEGKERRDVLTDFIRGDGRLFSMGAPAGLLADHERFVADRVGTFKDPNYEYSNILPYKKNLQTGENELDIPFGEPIRGLLETLVRIGATPQTGVYEPTALLDLVL